MNIKKARALAAIYATMESAEIRRRLAQGDLADPARNAALAELRRRDELPSPRSQPQPQRFAAMPEAPATDDDSPAVMWPRIASGLGGAVFAYWVLPGPYALLGCLVALTPLLMALGKGLIGDMETPPDAFIWVFGTSPFWLGALTMILLWSRLSIWSLIPAGFVFLVSLVVVSVIGMIISGATHRGPWSALAKQATDVQSKMASALRRH